VYPSSTLQIVAHALFQYCQRPAQQRNPILFECIGSGSTLVRINIPFRSMRIYLNTTLVLC